MAVIFKVSLSPDIISVDDRTSTQAYCTEGMCAGRPVSNLEIIVITS